jgi:predicted membrane protein
MRRLFRAAVLAIALAVPVASPAPAKAAAQEPQSTEIFGLTKEQVFIVGAGVVVGALAVHLLIGADFTYFAGAVAGGLAADWWYEHGGKSQLPKLMKRLGAAAPGAARPSPLATTGR